ncbi:hypothetical protein M885DRAFT_511880 [Pelagophyceae sp. CCMP2097]|nr:hypothetical protein M885DRAFT_511880 [Pelagophyceae sp. CCMP2097]
MLACCLFSWLAPLHALAGFGAPKAVVPKFSKFVKDGQSSLKAQWASHYVLQEAGATAASVWAREASGATAAWVYVGSVNASPNFDAAQAVAAQKPLISATAKRLHASLSTAVIDLGLAHRDAAPRDVKAVSKCQVDPTLNPKTDVGFKPASSLDQPS